MADAELDITQGTTEEAAAVGVATNGIDQVPPQAREMQDAARESTPTTAVSDKDRDNTRVRTQDNGDKDETEGSARAQYRGQELPEPIRHKDGGRGMMQGLPSINLAELTTILLDPSMPSQKIMKEVADKMLLKSEESESDDGSVGAGGGVVGMKGLLDCIFEVSYKQSDSDNSDDDDESFERIPREIPCNLCHKIFGSTMAWKTHVLVAHQDPSVLNIRRLSANEADKKERHQPSHRRYSRSSSKSESDVKDCKLRHSSKSANKSTTESAPGEERLASSSRRLSSASKVEQKETSNKFPTSQTCTESVSLPSREGGDLEGKSESGLMVHVDVAESLKVDEQPTCAGMTAQGDSAHPGPAVPVYSHKPDNDDVAEPHLGQAKPDSSLKHDDDDVSHPQPPAQAVKTHSVKHDDDVSHPQQPAQAGTTHSEILDPPLKQDDIAGSAMTTPNLHGEESSRTSQQMEEKLVKRDTGTSLEPIAPERKRKSSAAAEPPVSEAAPSSPKRSRKLNNDPST